MNTIWIVELDNGDILELFVPERIVLLFTVERMAEELSGDGYPINVYRGEVQDGEIIKELA